MTNIEKNAVKIWGLFNPAPDTHCPELHAENKRHLSKRYTEYNGLMPIVWECNNRKECQIIEIGLNQVSIIYINIANLTNEVNTNQFISEPEFIEALQECIIKYLELKKENQNENL